MIDNIKNKLERNYQALMRRKQYLNENVISGHKLHVGKELYEWQEYAECATDPVLHQNVLSDRRGIGHQTYIQMAKDQCARCVVRKHCALFADVTEYRMNRTPLNALADIWGGETPIERLKRRKAEGWLMPASLNSNVMALKDKERILMDVGKLLKRIELVRDELKLLETDLVKSIKEGRKRTNDTRKNKRPIKEQ